MVTKNSINSTIPIQVSLGGTNATSFATDTGILKFDGTRLVTSAAAKIDSSNQYTNSSQPSFSAYLNAPVADVTGSGTAYTLGSTALTEIFDRGSDFNVNGTFTAPLTARYYLNVHASTTGSTAATQCAVTIITSKRNYFYTTNRPAGASDFNVLNACIADMDAGDTFTSTVAVSGDGADTTDVNGDADFLTGMSGYLLC